MKRTPAFFAFFAAFAAFAAFAFFTAFASAQQPAPAADQDKKDEGIPVTSPLVRQRCGSCHRADEQGRMTRISYRRTTAEGWEETIKRMVALNDVKLDPSDAREIIRYLADHHGLAPEEAQPGAFEVERRMVDYKYTADKDTEETCIKCHSFGRVLLQRRTKEEWELLLAMHRGYYPLVDFQAFRRGGPPPRDQKPGPDGRPPDNRHPMEKALAHLTTAFPLTTPEWSAWSATMRPPQLQGKWAVSGTELGKGALYGIVNISPQGESGSDFTTETTFTYARSGKTVTRRGRAIVYTGYQWRGKSDEFREVLAIDRDWRHASGRWFSGAYDEFGLDVHLTRVGADPILLGAAEPRLRAGAANQDVHLFGVNLPAQPAASALNFGPGVTVDRIVLATPDRMTVSVSVASNATAGRRAVFLAGASGDASVAVYNTIDFIKVLPQAGLSRVGGANFPKQFQQFEAIAVANGPDGKPNTKDDVDLGLVDASWSIEEYTATYDDDDKEFVGAIDPASGLFTPNIDGPNPKRRNNANNYGDVWVVASYAPPGSSNGSKTMKARAHLLVTVPLYIKWDQPEVGR
ncbi:MAG TPA: quinohemoprotein amine dehydrogenase subunit alpha [Vicinamibacterales bacterium]|nr:quinohemoprotein amine dehydrogenase subunit alpha [Vicinamibacterales bacterium]